MHTVEPKETRYAVSSGLILGQKQSPRNGSSQRSMLEVANSGDLRNFFRQSQMSVDTIHELQTYR